MFEIHAQGLLFCWANRQRNHVCGILQSCYILLVQDLLLMSHLCCGLTRGETFWPLHKQYISQFHCWE